MKRIGFRVEPAEWHFHEERRRWIYDLTDPAVTEEAWREGRVAASIDADGYFERPDQFEPLPAGSWRPLPFRYFERASDIPIGNVEIERLMVAFGVQVKPTVDVEREGFFARIARAFSSSWHRRDNRMHMHDVLFLRLLVLSQFEKRPAKTHDFRIDVFDPGEPLPSRHEKGASPDEEAPIL